MPRRRIYAELERAPEEEETAEPAFAEPEAADRELVARASGRDINGAESNS